MKPLHLPSEITATHDAYSTRVNGADKPFEMSLTEMDAYIRRHMPPTKRNSVGLPAFPHHTQPACFAHTLAGRQRVRS